jgi:hypothetical protein
MIPYNRCPLKLAKAGPCPKDDSVGGNQLWVCGSVQEWESIIPYKIPNNAIDAILKE